MYYILFLILSINLYAQSFDLQPKMYNENIQKYFSIFMDTHRKENINTIITKDFVPQIKTTSTKGILRSNLWIKFTVNNPTDKPIIWDLNFFHQQFDRMESWYFENNRLLKDEKKGDHYVDPSKTSFFDRSLFTYTTSAHQKGTVYILLAYSKGGQYELFHSVWTPDNFTHYKYIILLISTAILSSLGILLLYNLFLFFILRTKEYFYYNIYLIGVIFLVLAFQGIGAHFIWTNIPFLVDFSPMISVVFVYVSFIFFSRAFLETKKKLPKVDKILLFLIVLQIVALLISCCLDRVLGARLILLNTFSLLFFPFIGYYLWKKGDIIARGYAVASSVLAFIGLIALLRFTAIIPSSEWNFWIGRIGFIVEGVLLAIALADRINILKIQRDKAQKEKSLLLLRDKELLEAEVQKRTLELEEAKRQAENLARHDELTGLFNRRAFLQESDYLIKEAKRYTTPLSLISIDIDHFKKVNDTYGHDAGDKVLQGFSKEVVRTIRETDIFARIGGEEFVLILPHTNLDSAVEIAEKIRQNISDLKIEYQQLQICITASLGVSKLDLQNDHNVKILMSRSDKALYRAKNSGRNNVQVEK